LYYAGMSDDAAHQAPGQVWSSIRRAAVPAAIFVTVAVTHFLGLVTSFDSMWSIPIARSVLREGNVNLDEYGDLLARNHFFAIESIDHHYYSFFPIGAPLLAVPVLAVLDAVGIRPHPTKTEKLVASLVVALTAVLVYGLGRRSLDIPRALLLTFIFAFCTAAWSTASRGLWQHGPTMLMLTLALWIIARARKQPGLIVLAALPLAFSYIVRPTNAISIALLSLLVLIQFRAYFVRYVLLAQVVAVPFVLFSFSIYHSPLPHYYDPARIGHAGHLLEAMIGNLISPNRGAVVFSPVLLLSVYGAWRSLRHGGMLLDWFLAAIVLLHWLAISSFPHWWGGHSFGNRLLADMLPYFMYFLIPVIALLPGPPGPHRVVRVSVAATLIVISFVINYRGANERAVFRWNRTPVDIDMRPSRVWDWGDLQFLRGANDARGGEARSAERAR
jgi:hypothetical protein